MNYRILFVFIPIILQGYSVSSTEIEYDGQKTILKGDVSLIHEDLKAQSDQAMIEVENGPYRLKKATLDGHVLFKLAKHGMIFCDHSLLDFEKRQGLLKMNHGKLLYQGNLDFNHANYPILCECDESEFDLSENSSQPLTISELRLFGHLKTKINHHYELQAEKAVIQFERNSESLLPKSLELVDQQECMNLAFPYGRLKTNFLKFFFRDQEIFLGKTNGLIHILGTTDFTCESLTYSYDKKVVSIKGPISVLNSPTGSFETNSNLEIHDFDPQDAYQFNKMLIHSAFSMHYQGHKIDSNKGCEINHARREVCINSHDSDCKVFYQFQDIHIRSNHLKVKYKENLESIDLIQFLGETWITLKNPIQDIQHIMCSKISFYPLEKKIKIEANSSEKVLFWTKEEDLAMTTEAITITLDEDSNLKKCEFIGLTKALVHKQIPSNFLKL